MIANDQMISDRYGRAYRTRKLVRDIQATLRAGGIVILSTYTRHTQYDKPGHADLFKYSNARAYVRRPRSQKYDIIYDGYAGCAVSFWSPRTAW